MAELRVSQEDLEAVLGVRQSTISDVLNGKPEFSRFVHPINEALGMTWPPGIEGKLERIASALEGLSDSQIAQVEAYAEFLRSREG
jgi:transcriptional regulator with XRE-family HTH domain